MPAYANRRDGPHKAIVEALRAMGCYVEDAARDTGRGYDLLVLFRGRVYFLEVKTLQQRDYLTPNEATNRDAIEHNGGNYFVVSAANETLGVIGAIAKELHHD